MKESSLTNAYIEPEAGLIRSLLITVLFCSVSFFLVYHYSLVSHEGAQVSDWLLHQYFYSYQDLGFVKRGLVGSIIYPFDSVLTRDGLIFLSFVFAFTAISLFWYYFSIKTRSLPFSSVLSLGIFFAFSPAFAAHIGFDLGRYDWAGMSIFIVSMILLEKRKYIVVSLLSCLGILIHEAYFVFFLPTLVASVFVFNNGDIFKDIPFRNLSRLLILPVCCVFLTFGFGKSDLSDSSSIRMKLSQNQNFSNIALENPWDDPLNVLTRTLSDNFDYLVKYLGPEGILFKPAVVMGILYVVLLVMLAMYIIKINRIPFRISHLGAVSSIFLLVIAVDFARFAALSAITLFVFIMFLLGRQERSGIACRVPLWLAPISIVLFYFLGPLGDITLFPTSVFKSMQIGISHW